jgi:hypothetical protein
MSSWTTYPKLFNLGHPNIVSLFNDTVLIEEKVDGSQFSFGFIEGVLRCKSKNAPIDVDGPPDLFGPAVETVKRLHAEGKLTPEWTYRGEAFKSAHHNSLTYDRAPAGGIMLFDIARSHENYLSRGEKEAEAARLGLELVPVIYVGRVGSPQELNALLDRVSVLGGQKIEGIVIKNYARFAVDGKPLMGKLVSEAFREVNRETWKGMKETSGDIIDKLAIAYATTARWEKAIQHLRDDGRLTNSPKDIGELMKEVALDVRAECTEEMKAILFKWAWEKLHRRLTHGLPGWYKNRLVEQQFASADEGAA